MNYSFRSVLIVPADQRDPANALAAYITGGDPAAEARTYSRPLRAAGGSGDPTFYGCCTAVDDGMLTRMATVFSAGEVPGVRFYRWDVLSELLLATNSATNGIIGSAWGWSESLTDYGLEEIPVAETINEASE